jgi:hypothetical protein
LHRQAAAASQRDARLREDGRRPGQIECEPCRDHRDYHLRFHEREMTPQALARPAAEWKIRERVTLVA